MKKLFKKYFLWFAVINLASFALYYASSYLLGIDAIEYVRYFIGEAIDFALPVVASALVAAAIGRFGFKGLALAPIISLARVIYSYPYFYLHLVGGGLLTDEALLLSLPFSLAVALIDCLAVSFLAFIIYMITTGLARKSKREFGECISAIGTPFDFSSEFTVATLSVGGIIFVINLAAEIFDTVSYLVNYSGSYRIDEIIYIVISLVMILAELLLAQYLAIVVVKKTKDV